MLNEGEKARSLLVTFSESAPPPAHPDAPSREPQPARPTPVGAMPFGIAGIASFAAFGAWGLAERAAGQCATGCSQAQESSALTKFRIGDVSLGVGVVALGLATWMYLTRRTTEPPRRSRLRPVPGGGMGYLVAPF